MEPSRPDFLMILRALSTHDVRFIIVGGVCGVLHGAPISTFDLDLVHSRTPENVKATLPTSSGPEGAAQRHPTHAQPMPTANTPPSAN